MNRIGTGALVWGSTGVLALTVVWLTAAVEPMRWRLPVRYLLEAIDVYRVGGFPDFLMCMRVDLSPGEASDFVDAMFAPDERIAVDIGSAPELCPAAFWPIRFTAPTMAATADFWPNGTLEGSSGAIYEDGTLYFWSNTK